MTQHRNLPIRALLALVLAFATACAYLTPAVADVIYMPEVTEEMSDPAFWSNKVGNPNTVLATQDHIDAMNAAILQNSGTNMYDLANCSEGTFDGQALAASLKSATKTDAIYEYDYMYGRYYWDAVNQKAVLIERDAAINNTDTTSPTLYGPMIENAYDSDATDSMPYRFGICTERTYVLSYPSHDRILDADDDLDWDLNYQTALRFGEPVYIDAESDDGEFFHVKTSCTRGWVAAEDVAICASKDEWLSAWQFAPEDTLVVYDDKIVTEESNSAPATSQKLLTMGTCLKLATPEEYAGEAVRDAMNRSGINCHVVWMPVRNDADGSYSKQLALISEHCKVSEGYLPLTYENVAKVALNYLGDEYGWGGSLSTNDCSGYVRDVYKCFGLELARNTTWQSAQPVCSYDFTGMNESDKADLIRTLPVGTVMFFPDHEMIYLGSEGDNLYVISSVSRASTDSGTTAPRLRGSIINTLNTTYRRSGSTWLAALESANIPYLGVGASPVIEDVAYACKSGADAAWTQGQGLTSGLTFVFERNSNGAASLEHLTGIAVDGKDLVLDADYTAFSPSAIVELQAAYLESLSAGTHSLVVHFDDASDVAVSFTTKTVEIDDTTMHAIQASYSAGGFTGVSTASAEEGTTVSVTVIPNSGYVLKKVAAATAAGKSVALTKVNSTTYTFAVPNSDVFVEATFAKKTKLANTLRVTAKKRTAKYWKVKKRAVTVARPLVVKKAKGTVRYKVVKWTTKKAKKYLKVYAKTGKVRIKKGTPKGTYKFKVKVTAKGNANYKAKSKTVTCKIVVK